MTRRSTALVVALATLVMTGTGLAWASGVTLTSKKLGAAALATPAMFPLSLSFTNGGGGAGVRKAGNGDTITVVWSQLVDLTTMCSGWTNGPTAPGRLTYGWTIMDNGTANDTLVPNGSSSTCSSGLHVGSIDLGSTGYNQSGTTVDFPGTTNAISYNGSQTTLLLTLQGLQKGDTPSQVASGAAATFTPDASVTDRSARGCGANLARSTTTVQF